MCSLLWFVADHLLGWHNSVNLTKLLKYQSQLNNTILLMLACHVDYITSVAFPIGRVTSSHRKNKTCPLHLGETAREGCAIWGCFKIGEQVIQTRTTLDIFPCFWQSQLQTQIYMACRVYWALETRSAGSRPGYTSINQTHLLKKKITNLHKERV